jgi:hypothetical protein
MYVCVKERKKERERRRKIVREGGSERGRDGGVT